MGAETTWAREIADGRKVVVAVPVKNEEGTIGDGIRALVTQRAPISKIILLLNNCTDGTRLIASAAAGLDQRLEIVEVDLPAAQATAGEARRLALRHAAQEAGPAGVILTTDADCQPEAGWVAKNLRDIKAGADVVCGKARLDEADPMPERVHFDLARESMYASLLDEIAAIVDPDPADPWPRHQHHSGASIAMTSAILAKAGGAPHVAAGEDRALIERLQLFDARIRHAPDIEVTVSGRMAGRAVGGMAEALSRRAQKLDELTDAALEPAVDAYRRVLARARLRAIRQGGNGAAELAQDLLVNPGVVTAALRGAHFGAAWSVVQRMSPVLQRRRVGFAALARETRHAISLRDQLVQELLTERVGFHAG
jgi:hypothetical protein